MPQRPVVVAIAIRKKETFLEMEKVALQIGILGILPFHFFLLPQANPMTIHKSD